MKRMISLLISILLLLSIFAFTVSAEENYCELFEKQWFSLAQIDDYGNEQKPWSANSIAYVTVMNTSTENHFDMQKALAFKAEHNLDYDVEYYSLPASEFESLAKKLFNVKVDLHTTNIIDHEYEDEVFPKLFYNSETNTYDYICYPSGGGAFYTVYGYLKVDSTYTVYLQKESYGELYNEYAKAVATCDGSYAKLISLEVVERVPAKNTLTTPLPKGDTPVVSDPSSENASSDASDNTSSDESSEDTSSDSQITNLPTVKLASKYDVTLSANEGVFSPNAMVVITKKTDADLLAMIKTAIGSEYSKFLAFDFSATVDGAPVGPNGTVTVTFKLPTDYNADSVAVLYVSEDGEAEVIPSTPNKATRTVSAELSHFSTYVLASTATETAVEEKGNNTLLIVIIVLAVVLVAGGVAAWYFLIFKKNKTKKAD